MSGNEDVVACIELMIDFQQRNLCFRFYILLYFFLYDGSKPKPLDVHLT